MKHQGMGVCKNNKEWVNSVTSHTEYHTSAEQVKFDNTYLRFPFSIQLLSQSALTSNFKVSTCCSFLRFIVHTSGLSGLSWTELILSLVCLDLFPTAGHLSTTSEILP